MEPMAPSAWVRPNIFPLTKGRVTVPDRVTGYLHRAEIIERCMPTGRSLTFLQAPGGFGKTTLLAECCRAEAARGVPTAWLFMDEQDDGATLDTYLAFAFQQAGLEIAGSRAGAAVGVPEAGHRITTMLRAIQANGRPWVLALDELERVVNKQAVSVLNELVHANVANLHLALACRHMPVGLDIARPVFAGAEVVTAADLRFARADIARFFGGRLSRRQLVRVATESAGWAIALRVERESHGQRDAERAQVVVGVVENWIESRLWYDLSDDDREFVLDAGIPEWMDAELLDEALGGRNLMARLQSLQGLAGLLEPVRGGARKVWRLHALVRQHCVSRRRRETPRRYRSIQRRVARVLARRGETVAAARHAAEAGDAALLGAILTQAGGVQLLLRQGLDQLLAADRALTEETLALFPRLALVRIVAHVVKGELAEAARRLAAAQRELGGPAVADAELDSDLLLAEGILAQNGYESMGSRRFLRMTAGFARVANRPDVDPLARGAMEYGLCVVHNLKAEFDPALERARRARRWVGKTSSYINMALDFQYGQMAMAQGKVRQAAAWYRKGTKAAGERFLVDPRLGVLGEVLMRELDLERNRVRNQEEPLLSRALWQPSTQFASHAAAADMAVELAREARGVDYALEVLDEIWAVVRRTGLPQLERYLAGLRIAVFAGAGHVDDAEARWRYHGLPGSFDRCVDLAGQSWREMELLSCARLRLCTARGEFEAGRRLVGDLLAVATQRSLRRTQMRALGQAMAHEHAAGEPDLAAVHLAAFLRLFAETDYARPIVRERAATVPVLTRFLDADTASPRAKRAAVLLAAARAGEPETVPTLTGRELEVLRQLETRTDWQIAAALGVTRAGVRYHVQRLFAKLGVHGRQVAVERARSLGILPPEASK